MLGYVNMSTSNIYTTSDQLTCMAQHTKTYGGFERKDLPLRTVVLKVPVESRLCEAATSLVKDFFRIVVYRIL